MDTSIIDNYRSHLHFLRRLMMAMFVIQILSAIYYLFIPSLLEGSNIAPSQGVVIGIVLFTVSLIIASRRTDLEGQKHSKILRAITFGGIIHQHSIGINTIYSITFLVLAIFGEYLLYPNLETIERTQNYVSHEKLTPEVYEAVKHTDQYLEGQIHWITNSLILLVGVAILSLTILTLVKILPILFPETTILQYLSVSALIGVLAIILVLGFPSVPETPSDIELFS